MTRESSSFKFHTLLANCCRRQAALFTLSLVSMLAVLPISMMLTIQSFLRYMWDNNDPDTRKNVVESIRGVLMAQELADVALMALAVVAGIAMFRYLHSRSQTDFFGALPIRRGQIFAVRVSTGLLAVIPAYLLGVALTCGVCAAYGFVDAIDGTLLAYSILAHIAGFLLIYAVSILAAILCGHTLVALLVCGWLQFGLFFGFTAVRSLLDILYPARIIAQPDGELWLSPPIALFRMTTVLSELWTDEAPDYLTQSVLPALGCLVASAVLFALCYGLCRIRRSENAGLSIAFPVIELPFKLYMVSVIGIACGLVFHATASDWTTMFLGIVIGAAVAACVVEIVYDQDFRSLFRRWKSTLVFGAVAAVVLACMAMDITHWNSTLPDRADIVGADLSADDPSWNCGAANEDNSVVYSSISLLGIPFEQREEAEEESVSPLEAQENIDAIYSSASMGARAMQGDRSTIMEQGGEGVCGYQVAFKLKNGKTFRRQYYLPGDTDEIAENSAKVRFSQEYLDTRTAIAQAEKRKNQITFLKVGNYADVDDSNSTMGGKKISNQSTIIDILETLKEEYLSITQDYAEAHAPVAMLRVATQDVLDQWEGIDIDYWGYITDMDGLYDIPVYECETKTLAQLRLYAKGFVPGFGDQKIASVVSTVYDDDGTEQETVYTDPEEIAEWSEKLVPRSFDSILDPVYSLDYENYVVMLADGTSIQCTAHQEFSTKSEDSTAANSGIEQTASDGGTAVGIIGGADGPTAVFVTTSFGSPKAIVTIVLLAVGIVAAVLAAWLIHRRRKRQ
ncbi:DUF6449 domain-containing protein [Butyricicoccus sp.]|uniref:DUF6449 domain-containing protein n=1 Tax=Butyricicoccus sp. TaxID=2049021 RepID=UPI00373560FC